MVWRSAHMAFIPALTNFLIFGLFLGLFGIVLDVFYSEKVCELTLFESSWEIMAKSGENIRNVDFENGGRTGMAWDNDDGGVFETVTRRKRHRRSTGGTYQTNYVQETVCKISKEQFKQMPTDDKLVSLFEIMKEFGSLSTRMSGLEEDIDSIFAQNTITEKRLKVLEYKSIDQEARNRRNNLIFRGHPEFLHNDDCEGIIRSFLRAHLGIDTDLIRIQRAHRLGDPKSRRRFGQQPVNKPRPIIVAFSEYKDVENIMANANKLRGTEFGINRDYPNEIVQARSRLWADYKNEKARCERDKDRKVYIGFPAKLVVNGRINRDEFPLWKSLLRENRTQAGDQKSQVVPNTSIDSDGRGLENFKFTRWGQPSQPAERSEHDQSIQFTIGTNDSDNESLMDTEKSTSTYAPSDTENPSISLSNHYSALPCDVGDSDVTTAKSVPTDEYSEAMQRLQNTAANKSAPLPTDPETQAPTTPYAGENSAA